MHAEWRSAADFILRSLPPPGDRGTLSGLAYEMKWPRYSLRTLFFTTATLSCVVGFSAYRIHTSRSGRLATYQVWSLGGQTAASSSGIFVSPSSGLNRISLTMHHGFWGDLIGYDHPTAILLPDNEYSSPIDDEWRRDFESAIEKLPRLKAVFVERKDLPDNIRKKLGDKFPNIQFNRLDVD